MQEGLQPNIIKIPQQKNCIEENQSASRNAGDPIFLNQHNSFNRSFYISRHLKLRKVSQHSYISFNWNNWMNNHLERGKGSGSGGDPCGSPIEDQTQNSVYKVRQLKELDGSTVSFFSFYTLFLVEVVGEFSLQFLSIIVGSSSFNSISFIGGNWTELHITFTYNKYKCWLWIRSKFETMTIFLST